MKATVIEKKSRKKEPIREDLTLESLARKNVRIDSRVKSLALKSAEVLGIGSWGRIDFLVNYRGYSIAGQL